MDSSKKFSNPNPEESASFLSKLFFWWVLPFFKYGYQNDLQVKDIYNATKNDLSGPLGNKLGRRWDEQLQKSKKTKKKPSLKIAIFKTFVKSYSIFGLLMFLQCVVIKMLMPIVLAMYIKYFDVLYTDHNPKEGWGLACGVVFLAFANVVVNHWCNLGTQRIGMRVRIACCSLVYRKLLRLSRSSLGKTAAGQLINLLSNDVMRFDFAAMFLNYIWIMPIQVVIALYIMYGSIQLAAIPTLLAITLQAVPLQGYLSRLQGILRFKVAQLTDNRVKLMGEITSGIQVIKMYAWEKPFERVVELARKREIDVIRKTSYIKGFTTCLGVFTERATLYIAIVTFVLLGNNITGDIVFSTAQLLNTVQLYMSIFFPMGLASYAEAKVSIKRLEEFLTLEENETKSIENGIGKSLNKSAIKIVKANASWMPNPIVYTLIDINLDIKPGTLCCVVGSVGSGKSSLLHLLLRELPLAIGRLEVNGSVSYSSQEPWLFVSTVRQNILFGLPYIRNRYKEVVKVCALERDFEQFPQGDKTLVGERGVSLSGGQRARINLARSVYRDTDIYLFDDPLSAVDTQVGKHLFEKCIRNYLKEKTRILVTHQLQFLKDADLIVLLHNGRIEKVSTFKELSQKDLTDLSKEAEQAVVENVKEKTPEVDKRERLQSITSFSSSVGAEEDAAPETQELIEKGAIPTSTYVEYYRAGATILWLLFVAVLTVLAQVICNASDLWLTYWTNQETKRFVAYPDTEIDTLGITKASPTLGDAIDVTTSLPVQLDAVTTLKSLSQVLENTTSEFSIMENSTLAHLFSTVAPTEASSSVWTTETYIYIYTILIIGSIVLTTVRSLLFMNVCMTASKALHNKMFAHILKAPMRFFDTNPSGRILNRFSKDMGAVDEILPKVSIDTIQVLLVMIGILIMVFIVSPWMTVPAVLMSGLFLFVRKVYLASAQDVKRLEGTTRAPVFSHISASLYGIPTIRSSRAQQLVIDEFDVLQDQHTSTWFMFVATSEAFGFYLDTICFAFFATVAYQFLLFQDENTLSGNVGLVIAHSLILTGMVQYGIRQSAEVASNMTSVERVLQYTKLDQEGPFESLPTKKPPRDWPNAGQIDFSHTYLRYAPEEPPVLKDLNLQINSGEKVGIVGRTGAGKSTLIASLFRLAPIEGKIIIDSIDTGEIGLNDLRSNISIIPQEPVLFSSTLRYNLDPFEKNSDETIWKALESVELKKSIESLTQSVSEGGSNFSAGQRQLICLARAIVRDNKVLVMDEATANVDPHTDSLIQTTIRKNFKDCTVLTIAHRLNTVMDSDKVLVMDAGQAVEFAHPHELLQKPEGYFTKMVKQTGKTMEENLRKVAEDHYRNNFKKTITDDKEQDKTSELNNVINKEQINNTEKEEQIDHEETKIDSETDKKTNQE